MSSIIRGDDNFDSTPASHGRVVRTSGDISTTSTSLVDVTGASVTITTGANPVAYCLTASYLSATQWAFAWFNISVDNVLEFGTSGVQSRMSAANTDNLVSTAGQTAALTAASHTMKAVWKVDTGTGYLRANSSVATMFYAHEIK